MRTLDSGVVMYDVHYSDDDTGEDLTGDRIILVGNALSTLVAREEIWQVEQGGGATMGASCPPLSQRPVHLVLLLEFCTKFRLLLLLLLLLQPPRR